MTENLQPAWLALATDHLVHGNRLFVFIDGSSFAIVKKPGQHYYGGLGQSFNYSGTEYCLYEKTSGDHKKVHSGRAKKSDIERMRKMLQLSDDAGEMVIL